MTIVILKKRQLFCTPHNSFRTLKRSIFSALETSDLSKYKYDKALYKPRKRVKVLYNKKCAFFANTGLVNPRTSIFTEAKPKSRYWELKIDIGKLTQEIA